MDAGKIARHTAAGALVGGILAVHAGIAIGKRIVAPAKNMLNQKKDELKSKMKSSGITSSIWGDRK